MKSCASVIVQFINSHFDVLTNEKRAFFHGSTALKNSIIDWPLFTYLFQVQKSNEETTSGKNLLNPGFSKSGVNEEITSGKNLVDPGFSKLDVNEDRNITESVSDF